MILAPLSEEGIGMVRCLDCHNLINDQARHAVRPKTEVQDHRPTFRNVLADWKREAVHTLQQAFFRGENTLNPLEREHVVRIRRKLKQNTYCHGKGIYKREQLELTIPAKFRDVVEPLTRQSPQS